MKPIKLKDETHKRLNNVGLRGETFDDIINRMIDEAGYDGK